MPQQGVIEKDTRVIIWFKEDDFGVLYPQIGLENKHLVHSDSRTAAIVPKDYGAIVLPRPQHEEKPTAAVTAGGQQRSAAREHRARHTHTHRHRSECPAGH